MTPKRNAVARSWRWVGRVINSYDVAKRPRLTSWILAVICGIIVASGLLGYLVPAFVSRMLKG